ncbi:MAG TPA: hypothetical protein VL986_05355 [Terracidiphilus sp.]|nr:hypothetical protein [Terracidiphilus sp.]
MHLRKLFISAVLLIVAQLAALAQDKGFWVPESSSAKTITGEISIAETRLTMNYLNFPLGQIRALKPEEAGALFDADVNAPGGGYLYRLAVAADRRFLHKNTLCGTDDVQWMITWVQGRTLNVAFFSGANPPTLTMDALAGTNDRCGIFAYSR